MSEDNNNLSIKINIKTLPELPPSPSDEKDKNEPKLVIRSPSYIAFLNASLLASELDQKIQSGSYNSPSCKSTDQHSDLDATSPKLKFENITELNSPKSPN